MFYAKLDRPVTLERAAMATNSLNEQVPTWEPLARLMAARSYRSPGGERLSGMEQVSATLLSRFTVRWSEVYADLNPKDRLRDEQDGRTYDIKGVFEIGRRRWLEIHAAARAD